MMYLSEDQKAKWFALTFTFIFIWFGLAMFGIANGHDELPGEWMYRAATDKNLSLEFQNGK